MEYGKKIQVGNFIFVKYSKEINALVDDKKGGQKRKKVKADFIKVYAASQMWSIEYRNDFAMYHIIERGIDDEETRQGVAYVITNAYFASQIIPDEQYMKDLENAVNAFSERKSAQAGDISEEEDTEILEEERKEYERTHKDANDKEK